MRCMMDRNMLENEHMRGRAHETLAAWRGGVFFWGRGPQTTGPGAVKGRS